MDWRTDGWTAEERQTDRIRLYQKDNYNLPSSTLCLPCPVFIQQQSAPCDSSSDHGHSRTKTHSFKSPQG